MISQSLILVGIESGLEKPKQHPKSVSFPKTHAGISTVTTHCGPVEPKDRSWRWVPDPANRVKTCHKPDKDSTCQVPHSLPEAIPVKQNIQYPCLVHLACPTRCCEQHFQELKLWRGGLALLRSNN